MTKTEEKMSLIEFIEDNSKLFSVLGVFLALSIFSQTIFINPTIGRMIAFFSNVLALLIVTGIVIKKTKNKNLSLLTYCFAVLMAMLVGLIVASWAIEFIGFLKKI